MKVSAFCLWRSGSTIFYVLGSTAKPMKIDGKSVLAVSVCVTCLKIVIWVALATSDSRERKLKIDERSSSAKLGFASDFESKGCVYLQAVVFSGERQKLFYKQAKIEN